MASRESQAACRSRRPCSGLGTASGLWHAVCKGAQMLRKRNAARRLQRERLANGVPSDRAVSWEVVELYSQKDEQVVLIQFGLGHLGTQTRTGPEHLGTQSQKGPATERPTPGHPGAVRRRKAHPGSPRSGPNCYRDDDTSAIAARVASRMIVNPRTVIQSTGSRSLNHSVQVQPDGLPVVRDGQGQETPR